jgi:cytochrome P450
VPKIPIIPTLHIPKYLLAFVRHPISALQQIAANYGDIVAFSDINYFNNRPYKPVVLISHPTYIKHVLKDNVHNYSRGEVVREIKDLSAVDYFLGNGIFLSDNLDWQQQHELVKPLFAPDALSKHYTAVAEEVALMVSEWRTQSAKNPIIDIESSIHKSAYNILFHTQFVADKQFDNGPIFDAFQQVMHAVSFNTAIKKFIQLFISALFGKKNTEAELKDIRHLEQLVDAMIHQLINKELPPGALTTVLNEAYANKTITYKDYRDTIMNFLFAGFETTAAALCWSLYCFAKNPDEQEKIHQELDANKVERVEDWQERDLPYLKLCMKEAMRLYPPVWFYMRQCMEDDVIEGYKIRKGSIVMITPFVTHQHKDYWNNPQQFSPANFEKQQLQGKAFVYIPFGQGKRMCIGQGFANIQMHMILAELLSNFSFASPYKKEPSVNTAIIIKGKKPLRLIVKSRKAQA